MGKSFNLGVLILSIIVSFVIGFAVGKGNYVLKPINFGGIAPNLTSNDLYTTKSAFIQGKIIKVEGKNLTVQNTKGKSGVIKVSDNLIITSFSQSAKVPTATTSSDLASIQLNKEATLSLEEFNGEYRVVTITYPVPVPSIPPLKLSPPPVPKKASPSP